MAGPLRQTKIRNLILLADGLPVRRFLWKTDLSFPLTRLSFVTGADLGAVAFCTVIKNDIMPSDCPFQPQPPNSGSHSEGRSTLLRNGSASDLDVKRNPFPAPRS